MSTVRERITDRADQAIELISLIWHIKIYFLQIIVFSCREFDARWSTGAGVDRRLLEQPIYFHSVRQEFSVR